MRRIVPTLTVLALVGTLSACAAAPTPEPTATAKPTVDVCDVQAGAASNAVTVTGDFGAEPVVSFPAGLTATETQRTAVITGGGDKLPAGGTASVSYVFYDGTTGKKLDSFGYADGENPTFTASADTLIPGLAKTIGCTTVGSRIVSVVPPADAFGDAGYEDIGVAPGDTVVFVVDVKAIVPNRANGADQPTVDGYPTVTLAKDGTPTITVPKSDPPTSLQVELLKKGDGTAVQETSTITLQYLGIDWATGVAFDQTWGTGPTTFTLDSVIPGLSNALVGQTVGSQVLAVIPPALGYGEKGEGTSPLAGETLVFVIDILAVG